MRAAFVINNRNKENFVGKAVESALWQTHPCYILISDQFSTDNSVREIERAIAEYPRGADHDVHFVRCPIEGVYGMRACNEHFHWAWRQTPKECEWIFQLSSDDYSLPDRVKTCLHAIMNPLNDEIINPCSAVATTMFFEEPGNEKRQSCSGYPQQSGYVKAGEGLMNLAYGSVAAAYHRGFLDKVGSAESHTMDVYYGFLAALDKGFYVAAQPEHVHLLHADVDNMGFQGKMRGASGDEFMRLAELNHFQLAHLYYACLMKTQALYPQGILYEDQTAIYTMILGQAVGWLERRIDLHRANITPDVLPV